MATAKNTVTISINMEELEALVAELVAKELAGKIPALETPAKEEEAPAKTKGKAPAKGKVAKAKAEEPVDEEEDEEEEEEEDEDVDGVSREDLEAMTLTALRKVARTDYELTATDYKGMDKDALIDLILETADGAEDEEEDEDEDEGELSRKDELEAMSEKELRKIAIGLGFDKADVKEADKETLVESILDDEAGESDEDEDAEGDGGEDEAGDDEDWEGYTEDDLNAMSLAELREVAEEWELVVRAGTKKAGLVKLILEAQEDEEEDEDDE